MSKLQMNCNFITTKQLAAFLGLRSNTLEIWRLRGVGPRHVRFGRAVRYRLDDIEKYIEEQTFSSTSEADRKTTKIGTN